MKKETQEQQKSLEENFQKLDALLEVLAGEDLSLEEAFTAYSEGMQVLKQCNDQIDRVEKQVLKLNAQGELEELDTPS